MRTALGEALVMRRRTRVRFPPPPPPPPTTPGEGPARTASARGPSSRATGARWARSCGIFTGLDGAATGRLRLIHPVRMTRHREWARTMVSGAVSVTAVRPTTRSGEAVTVRSRPRSTSTDASRSEPDFASAWRRQRLTVEDRVARGRAARRDAPRSGHGRWQPAPDRPDPVALLEQQARTRVPELVPIRYGRMLVSPFTFFRGAASIMAADLAGTPRSGVTVQLCGDAHLSNFGLFGSPERRMLFDINDFDETLPGPWEWDVKRLAASFEVLGRDRGFTARGPAGDRHGRRARVPGPDAPRGRDGRSAGLVRAPGGRRAAQAGPPGGRRQARQQARGPRAGGHGGQGPFPGQHPRAGQARRRRRRRTPDRRRPADHRPDRGPRPPRAPPGRTPRPPSRSCSRPTGARSATSTTRSRSTATCTRPGRSSASAASAPAATSCCSSAATTTTRCSSRSRRRSRPSSKRFLGPSAYPNHGQRVVVGQRLMQAATDIFLGWQRITGLDGVTRDYYVRQFHDWKGSADVETMQVPGATLYSRICGATLGRAHARWGDRIAIAAYLGKGTGVRPRDRAVRRGVRRPERTRPRRVRRRRRVRTARGSDRHVAAALLATWRGVHRDGRRRC